MTILCLKELCVKVWCVKEVFVTIFCMREKEIERERESCVCVCANVVCVCDNVEAEEPKGRRRMRRRRRSGPVQSRKARKPQMFFLLPEGLPYLSTTQNDVGNNLAKQRTSITVSSPGRLNTG